jgi:hypothetical protein
MGKGFSLEQETGRRPLPGLTYDYVLRAQEKHLQEARRCIRRSAEILLGNLWISLDPIPETGGGAGPFREVGRKPEGKSFSCDEIFAGDVNDASDATFPTFSRRKTCAEVLCRFPMEPVGL